MLTFRTYTPDGKIAVEVKAKFASLINHDTFGAPPLVAPRDSRPSLAKPGDTVVYINPAHVSVFTLTRHDEDSD